MGRHGMNCSGPGSEQVAGGWEYGKETSGSIKYAELE